ncbi:flagellar basal body rod protein FlgG [Viridibacillus sp. YIM B01967]|uniref:Flagellar hook protein FlgE n=1 Tax=Viridibacillus soli TaxID=2798301 RepID=A0ABS1H504_9BACL|nr:flagellar basal body rod protein FlgG [Viridibacillus soli]MBK3494384.1 flagellar basal body rod protein FlgG [Viridibacillus soli]
MLRSMYSGISGLKNFQTKLDVIGNNIANVNTIGFKKGRVVFKDLMSQTAAGASGSTARNGGTNPKQIGLGAQIATIDTIHGQGSSQFTGRVLDMAIDGDGFFIVADSIAAPPASGGAPGGLTNEKYTRNGVFYMDNHGYLVNGDGKYVFGFSEGAKNGSVGTVSAPNYGELGTETTPKSKIGPIRIPTDATNINIGSDGTVSYTNSEGKLNFAGQLVLAKFPNTGGLLKEGSNYYTPTSNSGKAFYGYGGSSGVGKTLSSTIEMSNVDLSEEFTEMIVAQRGFQANTRIITTSDEILQELVNLKR